MYEGDDRWFSESSGMTDSRFWVWIDADSGEIVGSFVHDTTAFDDSIFAVLVGAGLLEASCDGDTCTYAQQEWTYDFSATLLDNGVIHFEYSVLCSHPTCYAGPGPDGGILFVPDGKGSYYVAGLTDQFPNLEGYYWENDELIETLFQINNFSQSELDNDLIEFGSGLNMYGGMPFGKDFKYWDTFPWWWNRGSVGQ